MWLTEPTTPVKFWPTILVVSPIRENHIGKEEGSGSSGQKDLGINAVRNNKVIKSQSYAYI